MFTRVVFVFVFFAGSLAGNNFLGVIEYEDFP